MLPFLSIPRDQVNGATSRRSSLLHASVWSVKSVNVAVFERHRWSAKPDCLSGFGSLVSLVFVFSALRAPADRGAEAERVCSLSASVHKLPEWHWGRLLVESQTSELSHFTILRPFGDFVLKANNKDRK